MCKKMHKQTVEDTTSNIAQYNNRPGDFLPVTVSVAQCVVPPLPRPTEAKNKICIYIYIYIYIYVCICMYIYIHIFIYLYLFIYFCLFIYIFIYLDLSNLFLYLCILEAYKGRKAQGIPSASPR